MEYIDGVDIDYIIEKQPQRLNKALKSLKHSIDILHGIKGNKVGQLNKNNNAYVIDIEGARFFDLEYEESFLKIRFNSNYKYLKSNNLDENRMEFYHICHCYGILSGAYELLNKNYYDIEDILGMISYLKKSIYSVCL